MNPNRRVYLSLLLCVLCAAPSFAAPPKQSVEAVIRDVDHLVQTTEQTRWHIDAEELASLQTDILLIICPSSLELRNAVHTQLKTRRSQHGDLKALWHAKGQDVKAISVPLRHERSLKLYASGLARAEQDCPFWVPPSSAYIERHRPTKQWYIGVDGGGMFNILPKGSPLLFGFGGSSRMTAGYGLNAHWTLRFGLEVGGAGLLDQEIETEDVDVQFFGGAPVALRRLWQIWFLEGDLGPIAVGVPWKETPDVGGRTSLMLGIISARLADLQPWAAVRMSVDYLPNRGVENGLVFRTGLRFGVDYRL